MPTLCGVISKNVLDNLTPGLVKEFNLDEEQVRTFLNSYLEQQLVRRTKSNRAPMPKGKNGRGRITGFLYFSQKHRPALVKAEPELSFGEIGKRLGAMWKELTPAKQKQYKVAAEKQNAKNGLPTPTPSS